MDSNESDDDHDMEEHISTNEDVDPNAALDDFIQQNIVKESALKDSKEGDQTNVSTHVAGDNETLFSGKVKEEYFVTKEDKPSEEDVLSKHPGFENFIKENSECSISSNASRSALCGETSTSTMGVVWREDLDILKAIQWQAVIVEKSQSAEISSHFSRIKRLSTVKRLLVFCSPLGIMLIMTSLTFKSWPLIEDGRIIILSSFTRKNLILVRLRSEYFIRGLIALFEKVVKDKWDDITGEVPEVETSRMNLLLVDMRNLDQKIDEGLASDEDKSSRISKLQELDYFEKMNSLDLMQKAKVKWEVEGDENSKFFHGLINSRRKSQSIHGIMHEGLWLSGPKDIKEAFINFYKKKFSCHGSQVSFPSFMPAHRHNASDQDLLEAVVSIEEIKTAVWDCGSNKASGPDGYSFLFIKRFWDLLKH
nr:RNA-directed DNA polymerase, eukaryota, reverse transcriptase zinc-binding domain protein [Tanacetum cinerariifolium]